MHYRFLWNYAINLDESETINCYGIMPTIFDMIYKTIKQDFEVKREDVVNNDTYTSGTYHLNGNSLKKKVLQGISIEEVYKLQFNCIDEAETFYSMFAKVTEFSI